VTLGILSLIVLSTLTLALAAPETDGSNMNRVTYWKGEEAGPDAEDWSQYRADAGHSGYTASQLPSDLSLVWKYEGKAPDPAWTGAHTRMDFDYACEPVISGDMLYFGSSSDCKVYALDALTGEERWTFFTDAPVRLAPAVWSAFSACCMERSGLYHQR
jgi:outer membrane protein assembly factor BamB